MNGNTRLRLLCGMLLLGCGEVLFAQQLSFNRDIRPLLSDNCFQCHGPDAAKRQGGLRLDVSEAAIRGGDSGPAVVPGKPEDSLLIQRIHSTDPELQMPPPESGRALTSAQKQVLQQWISSGAEYQPHWAFVPVQRPAVPAEEPPCGPLDAFLRQRQKMAGLQPAPEADRATLLRRVTLDLTGLPPTPQELDAFLADQSPQAWENVVDRLLQSPRYGERMAQQWLDFARYADSNGFQVDSSRQMWVWRDWVVDAFNSNQPFDQFTIEQLAGDLLDQPTQEQIIATGFNRNTRLNGEGGRIAEEWFAETVIDRVETVGLTWLGLSLNCCRCHDHKYDPISQKEFYQLFAYFNSIEESGVLDSEGGSPGQGNSQPVLQVSTRAIAEELQHLQLAVDEAKQRLAVAKQSAGERMAAWETETRQRLQSEEPAWRQLDVRTAVSKGGAELTRQPDGSWLAGGRNPEFDEYVFEAPLQGDRITGLLLECFPDERLPNRSLGRYSNGNFVLTGVLAELVAPGVTAPLPLELVRAVADYEQQGYTAAQILEEKDGRKRNRRGWAVDGPTRREICRAVFAAAAPVTIPAGASLRITLRHDAITGHNIGRLRLSASALPPETLTPTGAAFPDAIRGILLTAANQRSADQQRELVQYFASVGDAVVREAEQSLKSAEQAVQQRRSTLPVVMVMKERQQPREARVLVRGQYDRPGDVVPRGVPAALPTMPADQPQNRLGFARWLVSDKHPLTARVWVNRAWERFFGIGIVRTSENLGSQAEWPVHPELLDWLAAEFMQPTQILQVAGEGAHRWDIKALDKLIVMSAAYRQSARVDNALDPENRLAARGPRFRLSAETLRDQMLFVSGLLVEQQGGLSARPYMPEGVWDETSRYGDLRGYRADEGRGLYRRSLYTIWKRTAAPPNMTLFDAPNREVCTVKRSRTNTPLQALSLLNETTAVEAARKLAERMLREGGGTDQQRLKWGFRLVTARQPRPEELKLLETGLQQDLQDFSRAPQDAAKLLTVGASPADASLPPDQLAAWTLTANVLLNLDEVISH